jgi:flagellar biosynthesis chaperone FliJ
MKRFVWRLQRVLDIKIKEEQVKRAELLEITEKLAQAQGELLMQKRILADTINNLAQEQPKKRLDKQELFLKFAAVNDELIRKLAKSVAEIEKKQQEKISEVIKIKQFRKSLERLHDEAKLQFIKEQEKIEQKDVDELTNIGYSRKIMEADKWQNKEMSL